MGTGAPSGGTKLCRFDSYLSFLFLAVDQLAGRLFWIQDIVRVRVSPARPGCSSSVERLSGGQEAVGSTPITPTTACDILRSMNEYQIEVMQSIIKKQEADASRPKLSNRSELPMEPTKYRKKPVLIEAMEAVPPSYMEVYQWVEKNTLGSFNCLPIIDGEPGSRWPESGVSIDPRDGRMVIATLEGGHWVDPGDYVICGIAGEFYPCKPAIFEQTYEKV